MKISSAPSLRTVPASAARGLVEALDEIDGDVSGALMRSGLSQLNINNYGEISRHSFAKLSHECVLAFHYHNCRLVPHRRFPVSSFRLMCLSMLACPTLTIAADAAIEFQRVAFSGRPRIELFVEGDVARLVMGRDTPGRSVGDLLVAMFGLAAFHRLFGWLIGERIQLHRVTLSFSPAPEQEVFNELLQLQPDFDMEEDSIEFSASHLDLPIIRTYSELDALLALFPFDLLPPDYDAGGFGDRVRAAISSALSRGDGVPDQKRLAVMFGLTTPTLRRWLADEGTSLRMLQRDCMQQFTTNLLSSSGLSIKEIASRSGFSDVATFRRAFKTWLGMSPAEYRRTCGEQRLI